MPYITRNGLFIRETLDGALKAALKYEAFKVGGNRSHIVRQMDKENKVEESRLDQLLRIMNALSRGQGPGEHRNNLRWNCGKPRHLQGSAE